jgi:hypothetical protein
MQLPMIQRCRARQGARELPPVEIHVGLSCHVREYELEYIPAVRQAVEILICNEKNSAGGLDGAS